MVDAMRAAARVVLLFLAFTFGASAALGDDKVAASPDSPIVLKKVDGAITEPKSDKGGTVSVHAEGGTSALLYLPPRGVERGDDTVTYKVGGVAQAPIAISVARKGADLTAAEIYEPSFKALFMLFVLAILLENGLALLFRWRPYLGRFETRTTNPLIAFVIALLFVWQFHMDVVTALTNLYTHSKLDPSLPGMVVTAMIIAGGSAGVNRIMQTFGFRPVGSTEPDARKNLAMDQAWISVRSATVPNPGRLLVLINDQAVGVIEQCRPDTVAFPYLFRDPSRFPGSGGYVVEANKDYKIELKPDGQPQAQALKTWGPTIVGPRAVLDITL